MEGDTRALCKEWMGLGGVGRHGINSDGTVAALCPCYQLTLFKFTAAVFSSGANRQPTCKQTPSLPSPPPHPTTHPLYVPAAGAYVLRLHVVLNFAAPLQANMPIGT
jgi:hypothetical protein